MTQKQLEDYLWGAANIMRGMIDAAGFKQYIFPLLFFKRVSDIWDEEYQEASVLSCLSGNCIAARNIVEFAIQQFK